MMDEASMMAQFKEITGPFGRKGWTGSRVGILEDGTLIPILQLFGRMKFPQYNADIHFFYWLDKNPLNEKLENVGMLSRHPRNRKSALGIPAGTKAYHAEYRKRNKSRFKEYAKKAYEKRKKVLLDAAKGILEDPTPLPSVPVEELTGYDLIRHVMNLGRQTVLDEQKQEKE